MEITEDMVGKLVQYDHEGLRVGTVTVIRNNTVGIQPMWGRGGKKPHEIFVDKSDIVQLVERGIKQ